MGKLSKISGPVIVAEDMSGAQINEVVKVGDEELLGEIIALKYDKASIQVYEDTSGLKPGDKIVGTGAPLQVELGPGLLKSVFDGIQRPLDVIMDKTGAFIHRGVNIPALDVKSKWEFQAVAKKGDTLHPGDVLGTVQETNLEHKILVPPYVKSGKLSSIKSGTYTVRDTVAQIGSQNVGLSQMWSVRAPRPSKEKLRFSNPLVTGKRIMDTFFPIAKGGAGAIPGPFGSGKCVSGDTSILLQNGDYKPIAALFDEAFENPKNEVKIDGFEQTIELNEPLLVYSYFEGQIKPTQTRFFYKGKSDTLVKIQTRAGRSIQVTPVHKLFLYGSNGVPVEIPASQLCLGDCLAIPKQIPSLLNTSNIIANEASGSLQLQKTDQLSVKDWIASDEIISIETVPGPHDVYDVSLPGIENWVGGNLPTLLHNTVNQQDLAKYSDAQIIIYVGCGERGNEMTEVLTEFPKLEDPRTKKPLMERTVLIANTSNMPVAAREASVYTGITLAEYYRDMGYSVALMADSTSRWAEAMREISGRMEEMPGEEGYPAYLGRKLAEFYERAGSVQCLGSPNREGSVTVIGAVSPAGGDISEPVSQGTLRITKVFWALDANLSRRRHYPAINWLKSYSLYDSELSDWYADHVAKDFYPMRAQAMGLLQKEEELQNIVQLIGPDALPEKERLVLEATKMIREDFLQQNSFDPQDAYSTPLKQYWMLKTILHFFEKANDALALEMSLDKIMAVKAREKIPGLKRVPDADIKKTCESIQKELDAALTPRGHGEEGKRTMEAKSV